jgi:hypothetical protein
MVMSHTSTHVALFHPNIYVSRFAVHQKNHKCIFPHTAVSLTDKRRYPVTVVFVSTCTSRSLQANAASP